MLYLNDVLRVVLVTDAPDYPAFCRVIWNGHVREMTDLPAPAVTQLMDKVWQVEAALRQLLKPSKINLASLGNMTPHLHWHVIPRFEDDSHWPSPVWAAARRQGTRHTQPELVAQLRAMLAD